jgi:(S)-ureidoglycine aminohydrolase
MNTPFGETRTHVAYNHALVAPDGHVTSPLSQWHDTEGIVLISPAMHGGVGGPRFVQYLAQGSSGCQSTGAAPGTERLIYVLEGVASLDGTTLDPDTFAWFPPGDSYALTAAEGTSLLVFEKQYEPLPGVATPQRVTGSLSEASREPFLGDPDAMLATLLPVEPAFDMGVNVFTYQSGAMLPFVETHVMEHGLYMKQGQGVYRLGDAWYPVKAGDTIWMASYCPQWFVAMGKEPATYIYYKDIHRNPLFPGLPAEESPAE